MKNFIPSGFKPPVLNHEKFILTKLSAKHVLLDYAAVMSSIKIIKQIRGGGWPDETLTFEEDLIDLCWHQREFEFETSFAYTVLAPDESRCLGCVYIYPPDKPWIEAPEETDAIVNMWVTQEEYDKGLYPILFKSVKEWISSEWPFRNVYYSNREKPE